jgi:hypothetical protein
MSKAPETFAIGDWRRAFADADSKPVDDDVYLLRLRRALDVIDPQHSDLRAAMDAEIQSVSLRIAARVEAPESKPAARPRYTLDELLDASEYTYPLSPEEREWVDSPPVGREII